MKYREFQLNGVFIFSDNRSWEGFQLIFCVSSGKSFKLIKDSVPD